MAYGSVLFEAGFFVALLSRRCRLAALLAVLVFHGSIGAVSGIYFPHPIMLALLLAIPTTALLVRDRAARYRRLLPDLPLETKATMPPPWAVVGFGTPALIALLLLAAPLAPELFPASAGKSLSRGASLGADQMLLPATPLAYLIIALLGGILTLITVLWIGTDALSILLGRRQGALLEYDRRCSMSRRFAAWLQEQGCGPALQLQENAFDEALCAEGSALELSDTKYPDRAPVTGTPAMIAALGWLPGRKNSRWRVISLFGRLNGCAQFITFLIRRRFIEPANRERR
jgi:hypothetical protein